MLLPVLLGFSATMLNHAYQRSLQEGEKEALKGQVYGLLGVAEPSEQGIQLPPELREPRYNTVNSGLVAWVVNNQGELQWRSRSSELIHADEMPVVNRPFQPGEQRFFDILVNDEAHYAISFDTTWEDVNGERGFRFIAALNQTSMKRELQAYQKRLWRWLGGLAFLLIVVQTLIAKWGLSPLKQLANDLERMEEGTQNQLQGRYPADIQPVTDNLNRVLSSEQAQRERYRNTLSDLAHSLKTPLAVIRGHLESKNPSQRETLSQVVDEQISRMSDIVDHQLLRASAQVTRASHASVPIRPLVERLSNAMHKVYHHKGIRCQYNIPKQLSFHGDEADFMELMGNLIDNACKYGRHSVKISARKMGKDLTLVIEDDGVGVAPEVRQAVLTRGTRADTTPSGQGIGLAVAVDILTSYGGRIDIVQSQLGGAAFKICIPSGKK